MTQRGFMISAGQINNILTEDKQIFHEEKAELLTAGLTTANYIQVDDTGARHEGKKRLLHADRQRILRLL